MTATLDRNPAVATKKSSSPLLGTWQLTRLALRRDRLILPVWVILIGIIPSVGARAYADLYPTQIARDSLNATKDSNPSLNLLFGTPFDLSTAGSWASWRYGSLIALFIALACVLTVTRHTRAEEDSGRQELLSSGVVGRYATLTAAVIVSAGGALAAGLISTVAMTSIGLPLTGAVAFGLGIALVGWVFVAVATISVQVAEYSRTANGISATVLGIVYLLRALGDATRDVSWLSWLSPIGWATKVRPFAGERWWVLLLLFATAVALCAVGYRLLPRRDIGMGIFPTKLGPAQAAKSLRSPLALAWRLHRGTLLGWTVGFAILGALFGSLAAGIGDVVGESEQTRQILEKVGGTAGLVDAFLATITGLFAMIAALYGVQTTLRMRSEETAIQVEPLLATQVSRPRWMWSHLVFAFAGTLLLLTVSGLASGLFHGLRVGDVGGQLPHLLGMTLIQLPAVWVVIGAAILLFAYLPALISVAWAIAAGFILLSLFGPAIQLNQTLLDVSPFQHIPKSIGSGFTATPLLWLTGIALVALVAGFVGFRRRDIG